MFCSTEGDHNNDLGYATNSSHYSKFQWGHVFLSRKVCTRSRVDAVIVNIHYVALRPNSSQPFCFTLRQCGTSRKFTRVTVTVHRDTRLMDCSGDRGAAYCFLGPVVLSTRIWHTVVRLMADWQETFHATDHDINGGQL